MAPGWISDENGSYLIGYDGQKALGWRDYGGSRYYFDPSTGRMTIGTRWIDGSLYYFQAGGQLYNQPGWLRVGATVYLIDYNGSVVTGWRERGGSTYYFDPSTGQMAIGVASVEGKLYYFGSGGQLYQRPGWLKLGENYYLVDYDYSLVTGWHERGGSTYYFTDRGIMLTGRQLIDGTSYYFSPGGTLAAAADLYPQARAVLDQIGWDLKTAYLWSVKLDYDRTGLPSEGSNGTNFFASYGFEHLYGNCFVYAGTFVQMARILGYDARQVEGGVKRWDDTYAAHSWVEIDEGDQTYVYDPEYEWQYSKDGFRMVYGQKERWIYKVSGYMTDEPKQ
ncbi:MAG: hypothetical protein IJM83_09375 [Firmicutes bacterium]|nr:hypothetical protein [Bacillota bacterium]